VHNLETIHLGIDFFMRMRMRRHLGIPVISGIVLMLAFSSIPAFAEAHIDTCILMFNDPSSTDPVSSKWFCTSELLDDEHILVFGSGSTCHANVLEGDPQVAVVQPVHGSHCSTLGDQPFSFSYSVGGL